MKKKVKLDDQSFEELVNELLNKLQDDVNESDDNVKFYKTRLNNLNDNFAAERYGELFNEALKIKGSARDRVLKILAIIKDRVKAKEILNATKKISKEYSAEEIQDLHRKINEFDGTESN
jgi:2-hydroxy-3-keto-5-methylthiopentenyl-1-phosphate phosphatase